MKDVVIRLAGPGVEVPDMLMARMAVRLPSGNCWTISTNPCCSLPRTSPGR